MTAGPAGGRSAHIEIVVVTAGREVLTQFGERLILDLGRPLTLPMAIAPIVAIPRRNSLLV